MNPAVIVGAITLIGVVGFVISYEVYTSTQYRSTARTAALWQIIFALMVVGGIVSAFQIEAG